MMYWFLYYLEFRLLVNFWDNLLYFEYFANFFVNIFWDLLLIFDLFGLNLGCMIWHFELSFNLLWNKYLLFWLNWHLLNNLNVFLLINRHFNHINFFIIFNNLLDHFGGDSIGFFDCHWHLYNFTFTILVWDFFPVWDSLLEVDCEVSSICDNDSLLLLEWNSDSLGGWQVDRSINKNTNLADSSTGPKKSNDVIDSHSIESLGSKELENALVQLNAYFMVIVDSLQFFYQGLD